MKGFLRSKRFLALVTLVILLAAFAVPLAQHSFAATGRSSLNIAYVNYNDSGFTESGVQSANIFSTSVVGGPAPTNSPTASVTYDGKTFTPLTRAALSSTTLAPFDTLILFAICDIATSLTASQHTAINNYLAAGNKILLYDADRCAPTSAGNGAVGNADYSWFTFPFSTSNPGPQGASGTLTIVENDTLTTSPNILANDPFNSDELGDANTATTSDPHWRAAAKTTNVLGNNGFFLAYASNKGLIIYDGADRWFTRGGTKSLTDLFINELNQQYNPDNLPGTVPIASPTPTTPTATPSTPTPTTVPTGTQADLSVVKKFVSFGEKIQAGGELHYEITVTNNGPSDATGVTLTDDLPGPVFLEFTPQSSQGNGCAGSTTTTVSCDLGKLAKGKTAKVFITATADGAGTFTNAATVHADQPDPNMKNNTGQATITVEPAPNELFTLRGLGESIKFGLLIFAEGECIKGNLKECTILGNELLEHRPGLTGERAAQVLRVQLSAVCVQGLAKKAPAFCTPLFLFAISELLAPPKAH